MNNLVLLTYIIITGIVILSSIKTTKIDEEIYRNFYKTWTSFLILNIFIISGSLIFYYYNASFKELPQIKIFPIFSKIISIIMIFGSTSLLLVLTLCNSMQEISNFRTVKNIFWLCLSVLFYIYWF